MVALFLLDEQGKNVEKKWDWERLEMVTIGNQRDWERYRLSRRKNQRDRKWWNSLFQKEKCIDCSG